MGYCVYILHSADLSKFYIGYSSDFDLRITFHENSEFRKFTYNSNDWILFLKIDCQSQQQAMRIESHIKKMKSSVYIRNLKKYPEMIENLLNRFERLS